jgi:hypothetical protein
MTKIVLQPAGGIVASKHFEKTVRRPVALVDIKSFFDEQQWAELRDNVPTDRMSVWGVTNGQRNINRNKWKRIEKGDVVLFSGNNIIYASAVIVYIFHNRELANHLWGTDAEGQTWENMYFLDEIEWHTIPYAEFNRVAGYAPNYPIYNFNVLPEEKSSNILNTFNLFSDTYVPDISEEDFKAAVSQLDSVESLDAEGKVLARKEQSFLRKALFKNRNTFKCGICGKEFPIELLVAAHIKKRAECNKEERLDYKNIVMPMCKFGCDELYEKHYIVIVEGKIQGNQPVALTETVQKYIQDIEGRDCQFWNENSAKYFIWHSEKWRNKYT